VNWSGVKSILIIFFLITNSILLGILIESDNALYNIDSKILKSTIEILNKAQITIDENIVPHKNPKMSYAEAYNIIDDDESFAKSVIGEDAEYDGEKYISAAGSVEINGDEFLINYTDKEYFAQYSDNDKRIKAILKKIGFDDIGKYEIKSNISDGKNIISIISKLESKYLFDSKIELVMIDNYVESIRGVCFIQDTSVLSEVIETKSVTGVLIDFMNQYKANAPIEITGLNIGYYKGESEVYHKSVVLIPVWCIETSDGNKYYMDTRRTK
jgi:regulatory protein YycI of two-component signal transduction system YycFG